jgi:hypothetical protein
VTADFVPTDTTNYNSLPALSAGNFVIDKATPTATLAVSNSPQTYNGSPQSATVAISASSVPGGRQREYNGSATVPTNAATYAVTADFVPTDTTNYNSLPALSAGELRHRQGDIDNAPQWRRPVCLRRDDAQRRVGHGDRRWWPEYHCDVADLHGRPG